jgi:hypothetical protein
VGAPFGIGLLAAVAYFAEVRREIDASEQAGEPAAVDE